VANSVVILHVMKLRHQLISQDDILYSLVLWKLLGLYALVRWSVSTDRQIRRCLWLSVAAACIFAVVAILPSLALPGVPGILASHFGGTTSSGEPGGRGSSL